MYTYLIKQNDYTIGQSRGKNNAFKFIQKEVNRQGLFGYWQGDRYIVDGKPYFKIERGGNE